jgi:hypothetical protein
MTTQETKKYFIIEKAQWSFDKNPRFQIMKDKAYSLEDATKMLLAYEQLNDDEDKSYHLQVVDLLLGEEKKEKPNGKTEDEKLNEEMPF